MVALNPATGPIPKPEKREKAPRQGLRRSGGKSPGESGRKYERHFVNKYDEPDGPKGTNGKPLIHFKRNPGSGAFVELKGDVLGDIVALKLMFELKTWAKHTARGEKTMTLPMEILYKLDEEAKTENRVPMLIYHTKGDSEEWAVIRYSWLHEKIRDYELQIRSLTMQVEELLDDAA